MLYAVHGCYLLGNRPSWPRYLRVTAYSSIQVHAALARSLRASFNRHAAFFGRQAAMPIQGRRCAATACMSDLDNTSESIARLEFSFPLAAPRAEPRECEGRLFPAVTEQLLFEMSLLCGLRGCAGLPYK